MKFSQRYNVIKKSKLNAIEKSVLYALNQYANDDGDNIRPYLETLAPEAGLSDKGLRNCLKRLSSPAFGVLKITKKRIPNGICMRNCYKIDFDAIKDFAERPIKHKRGRRHQYIPAPTTDIYWNQVPLYTGKHCRYIPVPFTDIYRYRLPVSIYTEQSIRNSPLGTVHYEQPNMNKVLYNDCDDVSATCEKDDFVHPPILDPTFLNKNDVHPRSIVRHSEPGEGLSSPALRLDNNDIKQTIINNEQNESFQDDVVGPSFIIHPSFPSSLSSFLSFSSSPSFFPSPFSPPITPSLSSPLFPSSSPQPIHPSNSSSKPPLQKNKTKKVFHFKKQTLEITMTQQEQDKRKSYINAVNDKWKTYKPAVKPIKFTSDVARSICARIEENSLDEFLLTIDWLFQDKHKKSRATYLRENKYDSLETLSRPTKFTSYLNFALEWKSEGGEQSTQNGAESTGDHFLDMLYGKGKYAKQSYIDAEFEDKEPSLFTIGGNNGK